MIEPVEILEISDPWGQIDTVLDVTCYGDSNGVATLTAFDGSPPYLFSLDTGPLLPNGSATVTYTGLKPGYHIITVADAEGCEYPVSFFVNQPDSLYGLLGYKLDVKCNGDLSGSASLIAKGGTPPYMFTNNGPNGPTGPQSSNTFNFLGAGNYVVTIEDNHGCLTTVNYDILQPPVLTAITAHVSNISCFGMFDGEVVLSASGGTSPYTFSNDGINFFNDSTFSNLPAGSYTFYAEDFYNCSDSITVQIIEPQPVDVTVASVTDVLCFGTPSGSITLAGSGGTQPYQFSIDTAQTFTPNTTISNLAAGSYRIIIRDVNGCTDETLAILNEPTKLIGDIDVTELKCADDSNASATALITGGVAPYGYDWSHGSTQQTATNLAAGNYTVLVTDANNCQISVSTEVISPPAFNIDTTFYTDVTCFGGNDGLAGIGLSGGSPPYTYNWPSGDRDSIAENLMAGEHIVTITDTNGCVIMDTFLLVQPPEITIEVIDTEDAFCNLDNGSVTVLASGGVGEFTYSWGTTPP
ncbi:MAG: SprB repeat-containing protein, partial [Bacteroidetes bacterium]|nr:SprB repeat-containing protein [Bacteroidota bacterium]